MGSEESDVLMRAWHARDRLYHELFGPHSYALPKKYEAPADVEMATLSEASEIAAISGKSLSVRDINILAFEPNELRPFWTFASSGLSNPWFGQSEDVSGFGCEFVLKTKTPGRWAIKFLRRLIYYIISYSGTLSPGVMLRIDAPLFLEGQSEMGGLVVWYLDEAPETIYQLPSGQFAIFSVLGITSDECDFVETIDQYGCWCIQQIIRDAGYEQCTEPSRRSLLAGGQSESRLSSLRNYLENFGFKTGQS